MTDLDLHDAFVRATDAIDPPDLASGALATARLRRRRRRGITAVAVASVVVAIAVGTQLERRDVVVPPVSPPAPSVTVSPTVGPTPSPTATGTAEDRPWNPQEAGDLPAAPDWVAPALPDLLDPPTTSPNLAQAPVEAAVAAVEVGDAVRLLGTDGTWRTVPLTGDYPYFALSPAGTRLVIWESGESSPVTVVDVASGVSSQVAYPSDYVPFDTSWWQWLDEQRLYLSSGQGWLVPADGGATQPVPYVGYLTVDDDGEVLDVPDVSAPDVVTDWADGGRREVSTADLGHLDSLAANGNRLAATVGGRRAYVLDRRTLAPLATLPYRDRSSTYGGNGGVAMLGLTDDGTVLLFVASFGRGEEGFRVVAWDPDTGSLWLVSTNSMVRQVVFADGLLRATEG